VLYELNSRPAWVRIPLMGITALLAQVTREQKSGS
jgi:predicted trehalose synthase